MNGKIWTTVPAGVEEWKPPRFDGMAMCPECHTAVVFSGDRVVPHTRRGDEDRPRKRICFGR